MQLFDFKTTFNYYSDDPYIFNISALSDLRYENNIPYNYNIYFIAQTDKMYFHPQKFIIDKTNNRASGYYTLMVGSAIKIMPIEFDIPEIVSSIDVALDSYEYIILKDIDNTEVKSFHIYNLIQYTRTLFEVLYIGRSYGRKKQLNIVDRLSNQKHKALKQILINTSQNKSNKEIFILTFNFTHLKKIFNTDFKHFESSFEREIDRMKSFKNMSIPRKKEVDIIEEVLINYFKPQYNSLLKHSLNSMRTKAASFFSQIDITGLVIEFATKDTKVMLFSNDVPPKRIHLIKIPFKKNQYQSIAFNNFDLETSRKENIDYFLDIK